MTASVAPSPVIAPPGEPVAFVSRGKLAAAALYWLGWMVVRPRAVLTAGVSREVELLGVDALKLVAASALLLGLIASFQIAYQLEQFGAASLGPRVLGWFTWRELGPLLVAILVVSRSASAMAGELAAMTANAEIDALRAMGLDPVKYLIAPKVAALLITLPMLTIVADGLVTLGAWIATTGFLRVNTRYVVEQLHLAWSSRDMLVGLGKSLVFAFVIATFAAAEGLNVERRVGAIGEAASRGVVYCLLAVLAADTLINAVFYFIPALTY